MSSPLVALLFSFFLFLLLTEADAFNISTILGKYPDFTNFNNYLVQSGVASKIDAMQTVTVLAISNGNMGEVSGLSADALKKILSVHVILDYCDEKKLESLPLNKPTSFTTFYQKSGLAQNQEGSLKVTRRKDGDVAFGSAAPGSNQNSMFVKTIEAQPYNISVLQLSNFISVPASTSTSTAPPPSQKHGPVASPPTTDDSTAPTASPPKPSKAPTSTPSVAPEAAATPSEADAPDSAADSKSPSSSAVSLITSGDHLLRAVLTIFITSAWFLLTMI